jgi:hypothetical protein
MFMKSGLAAGLTVVGVAALLTTAWLVSQGEVQPWLWAHAVPVTAPSVVLGRTVTAQYSDPVARYLSRRQPLAGPRPGAELPG